MAAPLMPAAPSIAGRGASWRTARLAALDFETTGLDLRTDDVVSFGVVPIDHGRIRMAGALHRFVRPSVPPSPRSQQVHEQRPCDLADAPPIAEAAAELRDALDRRVLLAWFAEIELHFLGTIFGGSARRWRRRTIDVRNLAIAADGSDRSVRGTPGYGLTATAERFGVPVASPHEALDDALVTAQLFLVLATRLGGRGDVPIRRLFRVGGA